MTHDPRKAARRKAKPTLRTFVLFVSFCEIAGLRLSHAAMVTERRVEGGHGRGQIVCFHSICFVLVVRVAFSVLGTHGFFKPVSLQSFMRHRRAKPLKRIFPGWRRGAARSAAFTPLHVPNCVEAGILSRLPGLRKLKRRQRRAPVSNPDPGSANERGGSAGGRLSVRLEQGLDVLAQGKVAAAGAVALRLPTRSKRK